VIVVDTNVICYRWLRSPHSDDADKAWMKDPDWIAPLLWRSEFRNALSGALRKRIVTLEAALEILAKAEAQFVGREFLVSSAAVMQCVAESRCSAYDCEFVALAQEQRLTLLTADREILRDFPRTALSLDQFIAA
jgi:predicted nucleic acid-binding protein